MISVIRHIVAPLHTRIVNMIARAVVKNIDDTKKAQLLQLEILKDEVKDDVERLQPYGFTSVPKEGAEAVVVFPGGKRDHGIVIVVEDRRYRVKGLEAGEVAVYNDQDSKIVLKASGDIEITPKSGQKLKVNGDVDVTGTLTASTDVVGGGIHLKTHTHQYTDADTPSGGSGGTKSTEAPS